MYIQFKPDHSLEDYLCYIPDTRWIKTLSILKMSSNSLERERGRHVKQQKIPLEQRLCQWYTLNYNILMTKSTFTQLWIWFTLKRWKIPIYHVIYTSIVSNRLMAQSHWTSSKNVPARSDNFMKRGEDRLKRAILIFTTRQQSWSKCILLILLSSSMFFLFTLFSDLFVLLLCLHHDLYKTNIHHI